MVYVSADHFILTLRVLLHGLVAATDQRPLHMQTFVWFLDSLF